LNHISIAQASLAEVETQLEIAVRLEYLEPAATEMLLQHAVELGKQLYALRDALNRRK
jgi:four helix bundle protein